MLGPSNFITSLDFAPLTSNPTILQDLSYNMASELESLAGVFKIVHILGALNHQGQRCGKLLRALKTAEASAKRIERNVRRLDHLHALDGYNPRFCKKQN